jgi:hypothetical protein
MLQIQVTYCSLDLAYFMLSFDYLGTFYFHAIIVAHAKSHACSVGPMPLGNHIKVLVSQNATLLK